ncbi:putative ligand for members of the frizzled family of seven transmembrane receptors [Trypoxylus dichotomus]
MLLFCPIGILLIIAGLSWTTGKLPPTNHKSWSVCGTTRGLTRAQMDICMRLPNVTREALNGVQMAIKECEEQFRKERWNCSSLITKSGIPYSHKLFSKGYKETAFAYAIASAGVVIAVAKACAQDKLLNCNCGKITDKSEPFSGEATWKWGGCSHNVRYGIKFSKMFLDVREAASDTHSIINLHNNNVGRLAVSRNVERRCKCHGLSGSCTMRTCWNVAPPLKKIGNELKRKYIKALLVDQSNLGNGKRRKKKKMPKQVRNRSKVKRLFIKGGKRKELLNSLVYYEQSPSYCDARPDLDIAGTSERQCNLTTSETDNCSTLCCGRGYDRIMRPRTELKCEFKWCCDVKCQNETVREEVTICK